MAEEQNTDIDGNNPDRIEPILNKIKELWKQKPWLRLGQLLEDYIFVDGIRGDGTSVKLYYQTDITTYLRLCNALDGEKQ
jgi:hypothetical protein